MEIESELSRLLTLTCLLALTPWLAIVANLFLVGEPVAFRVVELPVVPVPFVFDIGTTIAVGILSPWWVDVAPFVQVELPEVVRDA